MILMSPHTLTPEQSRETQSIRNLVLRNHIVASFGLSNDKLANLDFSISDCAAADSCVASSLQTLVENVFAPPVPVAWINIPHTTHGWPNVGVIISFLGFGDEVT